MAKILVLNGPNLNLLGDREPDYYGHTTLEEINQLLSKIAKDAGHALTHYQSNAEHELVEQVQKAMREHVDFIIINPAAFTHTSIALRDALSATSIPFIEVHLSNIFAREPERRHSLLADLAVGIVAGFGGASYLLALEALVRHLKSRAG